MAHFLYINIRTTFSGHHMIFLPDQHKLASDTPVLANDFEWIQQLIVHNQAKHHLPYSVCPIHTHHGHTCIYTDVHNMTVYICPKEGNCQWHMCMHVGLKILCMYVRMHLVSSAYSNMSSCVDAEVDGSSVPTTIIGGCALSWKSYRHAISLTNTH